MGKFERHFSTQGFEAQTFPRAPVGQLSDTGQGLEARALGEIGGALQDTEAVLLKWHEREGNSQLDTSIGESHNKFGEFERTLFANTDEHDAAFKKLMEKTIPGLAGKNKSGAQKFKQYYTGKQKAKWQKVADEKKIRMTAGHNIASYLDNMLNVARDFTDEVSAKERLGVLVQGAIDDKTRTISQAATDFQKGFQNWREADVWRRATSIVRPDGEVDWEQTVEWFSQAENIQGMPEDIVEDFAGTARSQANTQKRRDDERLKDAQEQQRDNIYNMIESNAENISEAISSSELSAKEKASLRKLANNPDVKFNYSEYDKVADIIDGVARDTHTEEQADEAIRDGVGKHFDTTTAKSLRTKLSQNLKPDSPTRRPALTRGMTAIEEVFDIQIKSQEFKPADVEKESAFLLKKQRAKNDLEAYILEKDRTDEEIEKKVKVLTRIPKEEIVLGWLERILLPKRAPAFIGSEERLLAKRRLEALQKEPVWKTISESQKQKAEQAFRLGATFDEVVKELE